MFLFNNKGRKIKQCILLIMAFSLSFSSLFAEVIANDILNKNVQRWDITFSDTDNGDVNNIETMLQEVNKVAKEIDKISVLLPRATLTGSCGDTGCSLDSVQCDAVTETPFCPDGSVLNTTRDMCQKDPDVLECPDGFTYDTLVGQCIKPVKCPDGGIYVLERQRCEFPIIYECPEGYTEENGICVSPPLCSGGGIFNKDTNLCEINITYKCEDGWTENESGDCEKPPFCPDGSSYSNIFNKCISDFTKSCPSGYSLNLVNDRCEKNPDCPSGYTYNTSTNKCEAPNACSVGTYDAITGMCKLTTTGSNYWAYKTTGVSIGDDTYKTISAWSDGHMCNYCCGVSYIFNDNGCRYVVDAGGEFCYDDSSSEVEPVGTIEKDIDNIKYECKAGTATTYTSTSCPAGYSVTADGKCSTNPTCPSGGSFDGTIDKCYINYTKTCSTGTYDSVTDRCVLDADCFGGVLNIDSDKCEISKTKTCDIGVLNPEETKCVFSPNCLNDGIFNASLDGCKDDKVPLDCPVYTDVALDVCYEKENECYIDTSFPNRDTLSYSSVLESCLVEVNIVCSTSLTWNGALEKCEAVPICNYGVYYQENDFCFKGDYSCPIDPSLECKGTEEFNHWCSPWECNLNNQCGYAFCPDEQPPKDTSPWMLRSLLGDIAYTSNSQCTSVNCDIVTNRDISYCGEDTCPKGFGVYEENNRCYQDVCPDGSFLGQDNNCYIEE